MLLKQRVGIFVLRSDVGMCCIYLLRDSETGHTYQNVWVVFVNSSNNTTSSQPPSASMQTLPVGSSFLARIARRPSDLTHRVGFSCPVSLWKLTRAELKSDRACFATHHSPHKPIMVWNPSHKKMIMFVPAVNS